MFLLQWEENGTMKTDDVGLKFESKNQLGLFFSDEPNQRKIKTSVGENSAPVEKTNTAIKNAWCEEHTASLAPRVHVALYERRMDFRAISKEPRGTHTEPPCLCSCGALWFHIFKSSVDYHLAARPL
jgi:hypothetical protein